MCTITIDPNSISTAPATGGYTVLSVSGTVTNCASNNIGVTIACPGSSTGTHTGHVTGNTWTASGDVKCNCGDPVTIVATCHDSTPCSATYTTQLLCKCCPTVTSTYVSQGVWNSSGQELVTFITNLTFAAGCSVTVQRYFGDGFAGAVHTFNSSPASYQETHAYNPQFNYSSQLYVLSNPACVLPLVQITVASAPFCATKPFWIAACKTLQVLFLLTAAIAGVLSIASTSLVCTGINSALPAITTGFAIAAAIFFFILSAACRDCICAFFWKLIGQMLFVMGMVVLMFVLPANCTQPSPFATPTLALGAAVLLILAGGVGVLYVIWYQNYRSKCPLTICDYWQAIKDALIIAVFVALIVFFILGTGVTVTHLGLALLAILLLLSLTNQQIQTNQTAQKC